MSATSKEQGALVVQRLREVPSPLTVYVRRYPPGL